MDIISFREKTVEEVICYWIETEYVKREIGSLIVYLDMIDNFYEFSAGPKADAAGRDDNAMDVHDSLGKAYDSALKIAMDAEEKLKTILVAAIENKDRAFAKYENANLVGKMDVLMEYLSIVFEEIYASAPEVQLDNFYRVLHRCIEAIIA